MKKFFFIFIGIIVMLFTTLYIVVNSPVIIDFFAKKYAPEFGFNYKKISGNPIGGIVIENLDYKNSPLSKEIIIRINPYSILKGTVEVSKLDIKDVNVNTLDRVINDFSKMGQDKSSSENSSTSSIPFSFEMDNINLTLLPFKRYGVYVSREILSVDSIYYDTTKFNVGELHQIADTSLGKIDFRGTYHKRVLNLKGMNIENLNIDKIKALVEELSPKEGNSSDEKEDNSSSQKSNSDIDIFIPREIKANKIDFNSLPYTIPNRLKIGNVSLNGKNFDFDMEHMKILSGDLQLHFPTDTGSANLKLKVAKNTLVVEKGSLNNLDLNRVLSMIPSSPDDNQSNSEKNATLKSAEKKESIPVIPPLIEIKDFKFSMKKSLFEPVILKRVKADLKNALFSLKDMGFVRGELNVNSDTNFAKGRLNAVLKGLSLHIIKNKSRIRVKRELFKKYSIPLNADSFKEIPIGGIINQNGLSLDFSIEAKNILGDKNSTIPVDINTSNNTFSYNFKSGYFKLDDNLSIKTPYTPDAKLYFKLDNPYKKLHYKGVLKSRRVLLGDEKLNKIADNLEIDFDGGAKRIEAYIKSKLIKGSLKSLDMKTAELKLKSREKILLKKYLNLPPKLEKGYLYFELNSKLNFSEFDHIAGNLNIDSNIAKLKGVIKYKKGLSGDFKLSFPKKSLLRKFNKNLNLDIFNPTKLTIKENSKNSWRIAIRNRALNGYLNYIVDKNLLKGKIFISSTNLVISGNPLKDLNVDINTPSLKEFTKDIKDIYKIETPKIDGDLKISVKIANMDHIYVDIISKKLIPDDTARIKSPITNLDISLDLNLKSRELLIRKYTLNSAGMKIFANKSSKIVLKKKEIDIPVFWLNDSLKARGSYSFDKQKGKIILKSSNFKIDHQNAKIDASVDIKIGIDKEKIDAEGNIIILGGRVFYNINAKHYATDDDIIIVQNEKKRESSFFEKNIKLNIFIKSKKPLVFKQKDVFVELKPQLSLLKEYNSPLMMLGSIDLLKGGYYIFEGKKFVLGKSAIYFTGRATRPQLNINLIYKKYGKTVYITVSGKPTEPALNFSSNPYMSRDQILSFILFDTTQTAENAGDMMAMVGGGIAKSLLGNIGLKVDSLVLSQKGFQVGKKISDRVTVVYDQEDIDKKVIVRVKVSKRVETDLSVGQESQSIDIIYKKEF